MGKIDNLVRFSDYYDFDSALLDEAGVLNPTLNIDTRLFIDPLLLENSHFSIIKSNARKRYEAHFEKVIRLLRGSKVKEDTAWRNAQRHLHFPEVKWTCLGYGTSSVSGSGSGTDITGRIMQTASEIIDLGINDPDLFAAMALFEEGFGPDRISDMTTNVILEDLMQFTMSILDMIPVSGKWMEISLPQRKKHNVCLPINPFLKGSEPIILVPTDILRDLPIVLDWSDIESAASVNQSIRLEVSEQISGIWHAATLKDQRAMRDVVLSRRENFQSLLDIIKQVPQHPYDIKGDPKGEVFWRDISRWINSLEALELEKPSLLDLNGVTRVVSQIIEDFRFLIEERKISEELYRLDGRPRPEKSAQRLFFAIAYARCVSNNVDITPEADTGNGPVDFKVSAGYKGRVLVEIKLSTNTKVVKGYEKQLEKYKSAERAERAFYVVIDVGNMGKKREKLLNKKNEAMARGKSASEIVFVNGLRKPSASKL